MAVKNKGRKVFVEVDLNSDPANRDWQAIAQQRGGGISRAGATGDAGNKDDDGFASLIVTEQSWSISGDSVLDPTDPVWSFLLTKWETGDTVHVRVNHTYTNGKKDEGTAAITTLDESFNRDEVVGFSFAFQGDGKLSHVA